ncbi:MAG: SDR family NAD(P)-dependent oxidoreductase, partial [Alphaproteobacteria bacterium]|nr:SDR family NAD(P)-dependent oxidoreductase [Alphaproteobacteria bacterium]
MKNTAPWICWQPRSDWPYSAKSPDQIEQENNDGTAGGTDHHYRGRIGYRARYCPVVPAEGAAVAILDRSDNAAKAVADEIGAVAIACDVSDPTSVSAAVNKAAEAMGGLDGVINAAGILAEIGIADTTAEVFSRTVAVNLTATFLIIQAAAPLIQKVGRGTIVNIASGVGLIPAGPGSVAYVV